MLILKSGLKLREIHYSVVILLITLDCVTGTIREAWVKLGQMKSDVFVESNLIFLLFFSFVSSRNLSYFSLFPSLFFVLFTYYCYVVFIEKAFSLTYSANLP